MEDHWNAISASPFVGGGFIWVFAEEGIVRTDQGARIDAFSTYAPDGIVDPRHEKEGSYFTVRDLWCPVQIAPPVIDDSFNRSVTVANHYDFTSLAEYRFVWRLVRYHGPWDKESSPSVVATGDVASPAIALHAAGQLALPLPANWRESDAIALVAYGPDKEQLWTWTWATPARVSATTLPAPKAAAVAPKIEQKPGEIQLMAGEVAASLDENTGLFKTVRVGGKVLALTHGPLLTFARPGREAAVERLPLGSEDSTTQVRRLPAAHLASTIEIELDYTKQVSWAVLKLEIAPDGQTRKTIYDGSRRAGDGKNFNFPPQLVAAVRITHVHRSDGEAIAVKWVKLGYAANRFPIASSERPAISQGTERADRRSNRLARGQRRGGIEPGALDDAGQRHAAAGVQLQPHGRDALSRHHLQPSGRKTNLVQVARCRPVPRVAKPTARHLARRA